MFLVTGSNTGVGKEVSNILHSKNAVVYIAARNQAKAQSAIDDIRSRNANSTGALKFLQLDLSDLRSCSSAAGRFLATESQLDALFNNAGVLLPPQGSKTTQRYELQLGTNCLGHFSLTKKLTPLLQSTAALATARKDRYGFCGCRARLRRLPPQRRAFRLITWIIILRSRQCSSTV